MPPLAQRTLVHVRMHVRCVCVSVPLTDVRYVSTLVLLASLPAFPSAAHDPVYWMDQLISVANKSRKTYMKKTISGGARQAK